MSKVELITFGCRLNALESASMRAAALAAGHDNLVIVNSCAVTGEAVRQARQSIRRLKRERPGARIVVTGCAAQTEPETFAAMPEVAQVIGNAEKMRPESWASLVPPNDFGLETSERIRVNDIMEVAEIAPHLVEGFEGKARAIVQVQNGCNHRCTFCIIPFGRGNARSVPMGEAVRQIRRLVENGYNEVVLTGVDLTSYGEDLPGAPRLGALVKAILAHVPELPRLRLSSIDSVEADEALIEAFAGEERLMPHLHLSLQAGDNLILKRMKRRHAREDAIALCERLRRLRSDIVFGADIIAGFPTEDEDAFARSLALVEECGLTHLHVFPYSPRPQTPAARMPQVAQSAIKERAARLREAGAKALHAHYSAQIGRTLPLLVENGATGRAPDFTAAAVPADWPVGAILPAKITDYDGRKLQAAA